MKPGRIVALLGMLLLAAPVLAAAHHAQHDWSEPPEAACGLCLLAQSGAPCPSLPALPAPAAVPPPVLAHPAVPPLGPWLGQPVRAPPAPFAPEMV